jgi:tetrahydromethanopterin S-methyltransferase subunit G
MEFDMKDELIRQTIMDTQEDVDEIKEKLDKIDERLYEIQKNN